MNNIPQFVSLLLCISAFSGCLSDENANKVSDSSNIKVISNGLVSLAIDINHGGRVASFKLGEEEILQPQSDENDLRWGSTVWISPQADWNWPPPAFINQNAYQLISMDSTKIVIQSEKDDSSGYQLIKEFTMRADIPGINLVYTLKNYGNISRKVALWENTRVPYEGQTMFFPDSLWSTTDLNPIIQWNDPTAIIEFKDSLQPPIKVMATLKKGMNQYFFKNLIFTKSFPVFEEDEVAPGQAPLEIYMDRSAGFVELGLQGKFEDLAPGKTIKMKTRWALAKR